MESAEAKLEAQVIRWLSWFLSCVWQGPSPRKSGQGGDLRWQTGPTFADSPLLLKAKHLQSDGRHGIGHLQLVKGEISREKFWALASFASWGGEQQNSTRNFTAVSMATSTRGFAIFFTAALLQALQRQLGNPRSWGVREAAESRRFSRNTEDFRRKPQIVTFREGEGEWPRGGRGWPLTIWGLRGCYALLLRQRPLLKKKGFQT